MSGPEKKAKRVRRTPLTTVNDEMRRLQQAHALLIAIQHASNYDVEFSVSDTLIVVLALVDETLRGLDRLEVQHGRE